MTADTRRWFGLPDGGSVLYPVTADGRLLRPVARVSGGVVYLMGAREWRRVVEVEPERARQVAEARCNGSTKHPQH